MIVIFACVADDFLRKANTVSLFESFTMFVLLFFFCLDIDVITDCVRVVSGEFC